ncbi:MAG: hypothetical protein HRU02_11470 [Myxococcales bacterium]|nr:hypothetical protein [Myxococcales bacterium]
MGALLGVGIFLGAFAVLPEPAAGASDQGDPALDYVLQCQGCHLPDASGVASAGVPRLAGAVGRFLGVAGGRSYLVQVPGVAQAPLSDAALARLLNWLLLRFSAEELPEPFVPYTASEVSRHRRGPPLDVVATRRALLAEIQGSIAEAPSSPRVGEENAAGPDRSSR